MDVLTAHLTVRIEQLGLTSIKESYKGCFSPKLISINHIDPRQEKRIKNGENRLSSNQKADSGFGQGLRFKNDEKNEVILEG